MQYFNKVTESAISFAKQGMQVMTIMSPDGGKFVDVDVREGSPPQLLESNYRSACASMEQLAGFSDSKSAEGDKRLHQSNVKRYLKEIVALLEEEANMWSKRNTSHALDGDANFGTPCMDIFLQSRIVQELCNRAVLDNPRGCLPMVLSILARLLKTVNYPLLPHMTVHKPIANLISVAVRYDAMHMYTNAANAAAENMDSTDWEVFNKTEYSNYKRRIEVGLIGLLRVLWRKFSENPATLDYFTFEDRRRRGESLGSHSPLGRLNSSTGTPNSALVIQTQMDVLNALITMMHKPHAMLYVQESLLVALNIGDRRIERFIRAHTQLADQIVTDLCMRFQLAMDAAKAALGAPSLLYYGSQGSINVSVSTGAAGFGASPPTQTIKTPAAGRGASAPTNSILSPLSKISSFTLGSSTKAKNPPSIPHTESAVAGRGSVFNSPAASAYVFAKGALLGSSATASSNTTERLVTDDAASSNRNYAGDAKSSPMQNFLRALRFSVAVASALQRMPSLAAPGTDDSDGESTYEVFACRFIQGFLQDSLRSALQNRGESTSVAVSLVLRSMLEEMFAAEQLWTSHSSGTLPNNSSASSLKARSLLHCTTQFLCGILPETSHSVEVVTKRETFVYGPSTPTSEKIKSTTPIVAAQQVNYTAVMMGRVGSITRLISVSSYLSLCAVLQSAPLSLALQVLLGLPDDPNPPAGVSTVGGTSQSAQNRISAPLEYRTLDDALSSVCASLSVVAHLSLGDDLSPDCGTRGRLNTPSRPGQQAENELPSDSLNMRRYVELAAQGILGRLPGKALWSLLCSDPERSALSPDLLLALEENALRDSRSGAIEVLFRRLCSFLTLKYDEQVALTSMLQRTICLLSVIVLACPFRSTRGEQERADIAVFYLLQITDFLKQIDKLWKEVQGYLPRIQSGAAKVPAMRQVLQAAAQVEIENSIYFSICSEAALMTDSSSTVSTPAGTANQQSGAGKINIVHRVDAASWKMVEKEGAQSRNILESAVLLHEMRAELRAYVIAIRSLRTLLKDTVAMAAPSTSHSGDSTYQDMFEIADEQEEDEYASHVMRQTMHLCGWSIPAFRNKSWEPKEALQFVQTHSHLAASAADGMRGLAVLKPNCSLSSTRSSTPNASSVNLSSLLGSCGAVVGRRPLLLGNLDLRREEFLTEFQAMETGLEDIVRGVSSGGS